MKLLITPTLLNSWQYYLDTENEDSEDTREDGAKNDFVSMLQGKKIERTPAMMAGVLFEENILRVMEGEEIEVDDDRYVACVREAADILTGAAYQVKVDKIINVNEYEILLYGRVDFLSGPVAYDVKFTKNYHTGKYFKSAQHPLYLECLEHVPVFKYLASDGNNVYVEEYRKSDIEPIETMVRSFMVWMANQDEFRKYFLENWKAKY
jgi:hypothetical protein